MADEPSQAPLEPQAPEDTPTQSGPETPPEATGVPADPHAPDGFQGDVDWEKRYRDLHPEYTRATQRLSELRDMGFADEWIEAYQDPESREQAVLAFLEAHGLDLEDEDDGEDQDEDLDDDEDDAIPEVEELRSRLDERDQEELAAKLEDHLEDLEEQHGVELTQSQFERLFREITQGEISPRETERVFRAFIDERKQIADAAVKGLRQSKQNAPSPPPKGSQGTPEVPLGDEKARRKLALEVANRAYSSS